MLQVAERSTGVKRRALLVTQEAPADSVEAVADGPEPQPLLGEPFDRMKADPELERVRKRLLSGVAVVGALILMATIWSLVSSSSPLPSPSVDSKDIEPLVGAKPQPELREQHLPPMLSHPLDIEEIVKKRQSELNPTGLGGE